jgi:penicillin-binding protein 2
MESPNSKLVLDKTLRIYLGTVVCIFAVIFTRLAWLQIYQTEYFQGKAIDNTIRMIPDVASRGEIVDSKGQVLVSSRPVFTVSLDYLSLKDLKDEDIDNVIKTLVTILNDPEITSDSIKTLIKNQQGRYFEPIVIKRDIPMEIVTPIEERKRELPGVTVDTQPQRSYVYGTLAGHLLGYVHSIGEEIKNPGFEDYGMSDLVGKTGVEKEYEKYLRGKNGYQQVEVDSHGQPIRKISSGSIAPQAGNKLYLTIDLKLQQAMEKSFDETLAKVQLSHPKAKAGAAVVLEVKTGRVLAMASRPTLNPDDFNGNSLDQAKVNYYFRDSPPALRNRAVQGYYVPGSTFKPITGMSALESGKMNPLDTVVCSGRYWNPPYIKCTGVHGSVNYYTAMAKSCNVYFQEMARRAGIAEIGKIGAEFGLGRPTGIDLPYETTGLLPDLNWQKVVYAKAAEKINARIDKKIADLEKEYDAKIKAAPKESEKKQLERKLKGLKKVWEQQRKLD